MQRDLARQHSSVERLRLTLPRPAHVRPTLIGFLRARGVAGRGAPRLVVADVFDAGEALGLMCRFQIGGDLYAGSFVAPLAKIALDRSHPLACECAQIRRSAPHGRSA
jgi:hypothetical protein